MKAFKYTIISLILTSIGSAASFDYNCRPMYSSVERNNVLSSSEVQGYSWSLVDKVLPEKVKKKFYSLTPFGQDMSDNSLLSDRWNNMHDDMWDECFRHHWIIAELKPSPTCDSSLFKSKFHGSTDLTLFENYCHPTMPTKVSDIFLQASDVPAEFVNMWDEEYLTKNYTADIKTDRDLEIFLQLNIEAKRLWDEILKCEGLDAERARKAIANNDLSCPETKERLRHLAVNAANYFSSSRAVNGALVDYLNGKYVPGTISNDSPLLAGAYAIDGEEKYVDSMGWGGKKRNPVGEFVLGNRVRKYLNKEWLSRRYEKMVNDVQTKYGNFSIEEVLRQRLQIHPLFSQILIEILSSRYYSANLADDFSRIFKDKYASSWGVRGPFDLKEELKNLDGNLSDFTMTYLERMCEPAGLWPSAGFSALLHIQRKISIALPLEKVKFSPLRTLAPDISGDFRRIGYWAFDLGTAQLNCRRDKILPQLYYNDVKSIIKRYSEMFRRHVSE